MTMGLHSPAFVADDMFPEWGSMDTSEIEQSSLTDLDAFLDSSLWEGPSYSCPELGYDRLVEVDDTEMTDYSESSRSFLSALVE
jgi:hypothetical protein